MYFNVMYLHVLKFITRIQNFLSLEGLTIMPKKSNNKGGKVMRKIKEKINTKNFNISIILKKN